VYEGLTESYRVIGGKEAASEYNPKGRVRAVILPKRSASTKTDNSVPLKPSPGVNAPN
jgi:hypothetical protein